MTWRKGVLGVSTLLITVVFVKSQAAAFGKNHKKNANAQKKYRYTIAKKLMQCYPDFIIGCTDDAIIWPDSTKMLISENDNAQSAMALLDEPYLGDQFAQKYIMGKMTGEPGKNLDPGRIRYEPFFYKMYGKTESQVRKNLVEINWCPKLVGQKIMVTRINGVDKKLKAISKELDMHPELKKYISQIGGAFNWRPIKGTARQSAHSYGTTIDLNTDYSNYWQWDCKCTDENADLVYKNQFPQIIVDIFEKYGFIWGGKWYHYDTMHFEYRPELL